MKIFGYEINFNKAQNAAPVHQDEKVPEKADAKKIIKYPMALTRTKQDIATWRAALASAESIQNPNRTELYRLYKDVVLDPHLSSLMETRKNAILASNFVVTKNGKEKDDKTEFLKKKWFYQFVSYSLDSIFYGHSLIQFGDFKNDEFSDLSLVPREYVKPEFGIVTPTSYTLEGQSYLESPFKEWLIGVGEKDNLGLLAKAAPIVLWKKNALADWSNFISLYGTPLIIGKTNTKDEATVANMENGLKQMISSSYGIIDIEDLIELVETKSTSTAEIFDRLIERCNSELSKLILGQTSTSDQKAYVGAATVQERVMHQINEADEIFIENIFSYQLVPFLNMHGLGFSGYKIEAKPDDELTLIEKSKIDIELLKTGLYTIPEDYILETYGVPVIAIAPVVASGSTETTSTTKQDSVKNKLEDYYGNTEL